MPEFRGYELRTAREQAGLRLWQVAQEIHTSESCIRRWEACKEKVKPQMGLAARKFGRRCGERSAAQISHHKVPA